MLDAEKRTPLSGLAGRRRFLAAVGALGLLPGLARAEEKPVTWACGAGKPTRSGFHDFRYHVQDGKVTRITATMRFDLPGTDWIARQKDAKGGDRRGFEEDSYATLRRSRWSRRMKADIARRKVALGKLVDEADRPEIALIMRRWESRVRQAATGWLDLKLRNTKGRENKLEPVGLTVQFPPLGKTVDRRDVRITIEGFAQEPTGAPGAGKLKSRKFGTWTYNISRSGSDFASTGPAPRVRVTDQRQLQQIAALLFAQKPLLFRARVKDDVISEIVLKGGYVWREEFAVFKSLVPIAGGAARAMVQGSYESYAETGRKRGGTCEKDPCFLTTATVHAIGLADDCWELSVLRRFRDDWLAHQPFGQTMIADYYRLAPAIVLPINARVDATRIWQKTWLLGIMPAAFAACAGWNRVALFFYRRMTTRLQRLAGDASARN